jgi:hypothetical protein
MFNQHNEELHDIFGSNYETQPLFRQVSKKGFEKSISTFADVQCNYDISYNEFINYLNTTPKNLAIFKVTDKYPYEVTLESLVVGLNAETIGDYLITTSKASFESNRYYKTTLNSQLMSFTTKKQKYNYIKNFLFNTTNYFFDPETTYNIYSKRHLCQQLVYNYSYNKTMDRHNTLLTFLESDIEVRALLNLYIGSIASLLGSQNNLTMYLNISSILEDDYLDSIETYDEVLIKERNKLILLIDEHIKALL